MTHIYFRINMDFIHWKRRINHNVQILIALLKDILKVIYMIHSMVQSDVSEENHSTLILLLFGHMIMVKLKKMLMVACPTKNAWNGQMIKVQIKVINTVMDGMQEALHVVAMVHPKKLLRKSLSTGIHGVKNKSSLLSFTLSFKYNQM